LLADFGRSQKVTTTPFSAMLTEVYVDPSLVYEELAAPVWVAWDKREVDGQVACLAWSLLTWY
jgi:hypothetical protein